MTDATDARAEFDARFALARERLLRITASLVGTVDAEDVVQDTYLLGRRRFDQLRDDTAFEPWVTRIAVNLCFGRHRRGKRLRELLRRSCQAGQRRPTSAFANWWRHCRRASAPCLSCITATGTDWRRSRCCST